METDSTLTSSFVKELKEKYNIKEIINSRYENNDEINTFYEQYYNMIEKLEEIGFKIWKMFGDLWVAEKQILIINILSMILLLEKEALKAKRLVLGVIRKHKNNSQINKDKEYLLRLINNNYQTYNSRYNFIDININYEKITEIYKINRTKFKEEIEKEMQNLINERNERNEKMKK
jgi:hypothetical protein